MILKAKWSIVLEQYVTYKINYNLKLRICSTLTEKGCIDGTVKSFTWNL